ncbi:hypothetical protein JCM8547_000237 [Rhodosporidiobolus lusitaniae]
MNLLRVAQLLIGASAFAYAFPAPPSSSSSLLLIPADGSRSSVPDCAQYRSTVGARTRTDIYAVDGQCRAVIEAQNGNVQALMFEGEVGAQLVELRGPPSVQFYPEDVAETEVQAQLELSTLLWLHPVEVSSSSLDFSSSSSGQLPFLAVPVDPLPARVPRYEPDVLATLPGNEGSLVRLSSVASIALAQLSYLTSHPSYSQYSLVSIPLSPSSAFSSLSLEGRFPDVPAHAVERVKTHLEKLRFSPAVSRIVGGLEEKLSRDRLEDDVRMLSGEDQRGLREGEKWVSRHSMSEGALKAARWLEEKMRAYSFRCTPHTFLPHFTPMLECVYENSGLGDELLSRADGYTRDADVAAEALADAQGGRRYLGNETVVLAAHYDSRGSFGKPTAPGADDDASGTALVLAVAREIAHSSVRFARKVVFCLFAGEEQGLLGSQWYARRLAGETKEGGREDVAFMLQVDMVGFRKEGEPMQLARPDLIGLKEAGWLVGNLSEIYAPELVPGYTPACCSDHQEFVQQAYPATWIFERNGPIADPCYHHSCDLSDRSGYDFEQITAHAKVALATVLELGGFAYL